jgi:hypothetical protein
MRGSATHATFSGLTHISAGAELTVLGENRALEPTSDAFEDDFEP